MTLAIGVRAADQESIVLGLGEWRVTADPAATLVCLGLGSCVALCARDPLNKIGGMVHMVLPDSGEGRVQGNGAKFVDLAVPSSAPSCWRRVRTASGCPSTWWAAPRCSRAWRSPTP